MLQSPSSYAPACQSWSVGEQHRILLCILSLLPHKVYQFQSHERTANTHSIQILAGHRHVAHFHSRHIPLSCRIAIPCLLLQFPLFLNMAFFRLVTDILHTVAAWISWRSWNTPVYGPHNAVAYSANLWSTCSSEIGGATHPMPQPTQDREHTFRMMAILAFFKSTIFPMNLCHSYLLA